MPGEKLFKCPKCGKLSDGLIRIPLRERRKNMPLRKRNHFVCPNCGWVVARSYKKARTLFIEPEETD